MLLEEHCDKICLLLPCECNISHVQCVHLGTSHLSSAVVTQWKQLHVVQPATHTAGAPRRFIGKGAPLNYPATFVPKPILLEYKGVRGRQAHTKARGGGRGAAGQLSMNTQFGLGQKRSPDLEVTEHSRRTQLSHPASQLLLLCLSLKCLFYITLLLLSVFLPIHHNWEQLLIWLTAAVIASCT